MYTLITGASSGIGKALAQECAARGMNILLVALPGKELDELQQHIQEQYKVMCNSLGEDLADPNASARVYEWVRQNNFQVNMLINNVGIGSKAAFEKLSPAFYAKQINLNVMNTCLMTRMFIDDLKQHKPAYILNMGSMGGFFALPEKVVYAATKAFVFSFSQGLRLELADTGISVSVVCPGGTDTNPNTIASNKDLKGLAKKSVMQPEEVAKESITRLLKGDAVIIPGGVNKFIVGVSKIIPTSLQHMLVRRAFSRLKKHDY